MILLVFFSGLRPQMVLSFPTYRVRFLAKVFASCLANPLKHTHRHTYPSAFSTLLHSIHWYRLMPTVKDDFVKFHNPKSYVQMNLVFGSCYFVWMFVWCPANFQVLIMFLNNTANCAQFCFFKTVVFLRHKKRKKGQTITCGISKQSHVGLQLSLEHGVILGWVKFHQELRDHAWAIVWTRRSGYLYEWLVFWRKVLKWFPELWVKLIIQFHPMWTQR